MSVTIDQMVEDTANKLLGDLADQALVEAAEAGTWPRKLWEAVVEAGLTSALDDGDAGLGAAAAIARASGATPSPVPLVETLIARALAQRAGLALPDGPATIAPPRLARVALATRGSGRQLQGSIAGVPFGRWCMTVAVPVDGTLVLLPVEKLAWTKPVAPSPGKSGAGRAYSGEPRDTAHLDHPLAAGDSAALADAGAHADTLGALLRSFQMVGAMRSALAMTIQYANDRVQFGRPLGKFQALQHLVAVMAENAAAAEAAADMALAATATPRARVMLAVAKIRCGEAAGIVAAGAHQLHGAIGFTREHRLHHLTRRLWTWRDEFGHEGEWAAELGRLALGAGADGLWPLLTEA